MLNCHIDEWSRGDTTITTSTPSVVLLGLSVHNSRQVEEAINVAGARAYLTKTSSSRQLHMHVFEKILTDKKLI
jgi:hypothetical protein